MKWPSFHLDRMDRCSGGGSGCLWLSWSLGILTMPFSAVIHPMLNFPIGHFHSFSRKKVAIELKCADALFYISLVFP